MFIIETYLKHPLSSTDMNAVFFWYDGLKFSRELIEYLVEYCITTGHSSLRYMDKVALGWADEIGSLEKGKAADFCALSLAETNMQPVHKVLSNVIYSATGMENKITVVAGRVLYKDGFYTTIDYASLLEEAGKFNSYLK